MTPLAGFIIALIAGWITRDARRAAAIVVIPYLAVVAAQTWAIYDGRGTSPPSTVWPFSQAISYYAVQAIILALALSVAALLGAVRARRAAAHDGAARVGRRAVIASVVDGVLTAAFIIIALLVTAPGHQHAAEGSPPWYGLLGIGVSIVSLIVLSVLLVTGRRAAARAGRTVATSSTAMASGSRVVAVAAIGAVGVLGTAAGLSQAKAAPATSAGIVHIYESGIGGRTDHDVITGSFTDYGVDHLDVLDHGNVNKLVLSRGSLEANVSKLHASIKEVSGNNRTCNDNIQTVVPLENLTSVTGSGRVSFRRG